MATKKPKAAHPPFIYIVSTNSYDDKAPLRLWRVPVLGMHGDKYVVRNAGKLCGYRRRIDSNGKMIRGESITQLDEHIDSLTASLRAAGLAMDYARPYVLSTVAVEMIHACAKDANLVTALADAPGSRG